MKTMPSRPILGCLIFFGGSFLTPPGQAEEPGASHSPLAAEEATVLPKVTVRGEKEKRLTAPVPDVLPPRLASGEPPLEIFYPGRAYVDGVSKGVATVGVMLDDTGRATDFLLIAYSERYFGDALLRKARGTTFEPLRAKGVALPSRFIMGHVFYPDPDVPLVMNVSDAVSRKFAEFTGEAPLIYQPHPPSELDHPLELVRRATPLLPATYAAKPGRVTQVPVSFYVDETGLLRLPNVEATPSPLLVRNAIRALEQWRFQPPTIHGQPVLVQARCMLVFEPAGP